MKKEIKIKGSADPVNIKGTKTILNQMMNCICKIKIKGDNHGGFITKDAYGTGFFCVITLNDNTNINCLLTNYHVLNEKDLEESRKINLSLNDEKETKSIDLSIERKTYFNKDYDIALIELKDEDKIKDYLELDDNLFQDNSEKIYKNQSIYTLHYRNEKYF